MVKGKLVMNIHFFLSYGTPIFMVILFYTPIVPTERELFKNFENLQFVRIKNYFLTTGKISVTFNPNLFCSCSENF